MQPDDDYLDGLLASADPVVCVELIDWATIHDQGDEIVDGLLIPGRWTAIVAAAKKGKTALITSTTIEISEGRDPFDATRRDPVTVLYVDGELGRVALSDALAEIGYHDPALLTRWHATDLPPRLDTIEGGAALLVAARQLEAAVVAIDGINGTVTGAEKDDLTWRAFFDYTISPLKRAGLAVITGDNLGKDPTLGPRGSSVKVDKPDAVIQLDRTDQGVKLTTTHRRSAAYPHERILTVAGFDTGHLVTYRRAGTAWPEGTERIAALLDDLGLPVDVGRRKARAALTDAGHHAKTETLAAAIRWRKSTTTQLAASAALDLVEGQI